MPTLVRWFVKSALLYLVGALFVGAAVVAPGSPLWVRALTPVYFHLFMVGWVTQLIVGVSLWMFPRYSTDRPRGSEALGIATFVALNAGLLLRAIAEPMVSLAPWGWWGWSLILSATLQWLAGLLYVINIWARVKVR